MPREVIDIIAEIAGKIKEGRATPVDMMMLYKALQETPPMDAARVIEEVTTGAYTVVPTEPPPHWNPVQQRAWRIFIRMMAEHLTIPPTAQS